MQLFHDRQNAAARARINQQPAGETIRFDQLHAIRTDLPDRCWMAKRHIRLRCNFQRRDTEIILATSKTTGIKPSEVKCMRAKASSVFLLKSVPGKMVKRPRFRTDQVVAQSGIYRVRHRKHRLPHEVTLLKDEQFPRCSKCRNAVVFELVRDVTFTDESRGRNSRIRLYELPVLEDGKQSAA
jgi:hypothetical protein